MRNEHITSQAEAWDQIALSAYGQETQMGVLPPANVDWIDSLLFAGGIRLAVPVQKRPAKRSLPPWERM